MARGSLLFKGGALRQLKRGTSRSGGRNNLGRITAFHRGGGAKRSLRIVDMARRAPGIVGTVERLEYDPSRTASIALVRWENDEDCAAGGGPPLHFPRSPPAARGTAGKTFPKSIGDIPRGELRSAVATICGMPMPGAAAGRKVVRVDGGWRSRSFSSRGIGAFLCPEQEKVSLPGCNERSGNTYSEDNIILLRRFSDILRPIKTE